MKATATKLIAASITRPILIRASPMSKPICWKLVSPKMAAMIGLITPSRSASTIFWKYSAMIKPTAIVRMSPF